MIARVWRGRVRREDLEAYCAYVTRTGLRDYRSTPGNHGAYVFTRDHGDASEVVTLSLWDSMDSIRAFAGDDAARARYYPEDGRFLLEFPEHVEHYDVMN